MKWFRTHALITVVLWATLACSLSAGPGDTKLVYGSSTVLTSTTLNNASIGTSATWLLGWESGAVDNTSTTYCAIGPCLDFRVTAKLVTESAGVSAGEIRLYLVAPLDDSSWPDVFDGTESTETITDSEIRDGFVALCVSTATDGGASDTYYLDCPSVATAFKGHLPKKFLVFITQSTGTNFENTGTPNVVTVTGVYANVAQS